jgi:hypothetical protein
MIRHQITVSGVSGISDITSIIRTATPGTFTISTSSTAKQGYNDPTLYVNRAVGLIPNSIIENTLITNDGIIVVYRATDTIEVVDLFEGGNIVYGDIEPQDYLILTNYITGINPMHQRVFIISGNDGTHLETKYQKVYSDSNHTYFKTDMDLDLETDDYGHYKIATGSFVEKTNVFQLIKKQFYLIKVPAGVTVQYPSGTNLTSVGSDIYWFTDLDIGADKFLEIKLAGAATSGTVIIY